MEELLEKIIEQHTIALKWMDMRKKSLKMMRDTADEIDKHYKNVDISRIVGAGTAIAGGVVAVGGTVATLATAGLAAPITALMIVAGTVISIAGGTTSAGASIADMIIPKLKLSVVQKQIDADNEMLKELMKIRSEIEEIIKIRSLRVNRLHESRVEEVLEAPSLEKKEGVKDTLNVARTVSRVGSVATVIARIVGKTAVKFGGLVVKFGKNPAHATNVGRTIAKSGVVAANVGHVALKGAAVGGVVVQIVAIPVNIAEIVKGGMSLYRGSETEAGRQLRENAKKFEEQMKNVLKISGIPESAISDQIA